MNLRLLIGTACLAASTAAFADRAVENLTHGWSFSRDGSKPVPVRVPHDWAIAGPFDPAGDPDTGKLPWKGEGVYTRELVMSERPAGKRLFLDFDGVMAESAVFVNGHGVGKGEYGYLGFRCDLTPYLYAGTNVVTVRASTRRHFSRWYPGGGMYRPVRLVTTDDLYMPTDDFAVTTPVVTDEEATVEVKGKVTSRRLADASVRIAAELRNGDGVVVAAGDTEVSVAGFDDASFGLSLAVAKPKRWDMVPDPACYRLSVRLVADGASDTQSATVGFRTFSFDGKDGFHLNGRRVQLKGVNLHSDLGVLGMAFNRSAMRRQLEIMRRMGVNAIRTSHNPPAREVLDLCDEMGLFVWDECFDKWDGTCGRGDANLEEFVERCLTKLVRRDRNHPSVFVWSIGNEILYGPPLAPGIQEDWGYDHAIRTTPERCARFRRIIRREDATRPVGIGSNYPEVAETGDYEALDITGWNYREKYKPVKAKYPDKPILYSEIASTFSEGGYYSESMVTNLVDYDFTERKIDGYDRNGPSWGDVPDVELERLDRDSYLAGGFVWAGIDYLGEPSPYVENWMRGRGFKPADFARSSYFGICDLTGRPKDRYWLYRSVWNERAFTLHIVPEHWTFPDRVGRVLPVYVYTSADEAELFLNGKSLGRRRKDPSARASEKDYYGGLPRYRLMWNDVVYEPGRLSVVAYGNGGEVLGETAVSTAGRAARVNLEPESNTLPADCESLVFVNVSLVDDAGVFVPADGVVVRFAVSGPAEIVSVGNADPHGYESFKVVSRHPLYLGRAVAVLRRTGGGKVVLCARADEMEKAVAVFD